MVYLFLDVDECNASVSVCDVKATCQNTLGSYLCICESGFTGNGKTCIGKMCARAFSLNFDAVGKFLTTICIGNRAVRETVRD